MKSKKEPIQLRRGKAFHRKMQADWVETAEGDIRVEKTITKPTGRKGRVDVLADPEKKMVSVVEVKCSDWDRMTHKALRRNIRRQIRQIWSYIESQLDEGKEVCPGVIFPKRPKSIQRLKLIEELFEEEGIPVVWDDETIEERKDLARGQDKR